MQVKILIVPNGFLCGFRSSDIRVEHQTDPVTVKAYIVNISGFCVHSEGRSAGKKQADNRHNMHCCLLLARGCDIN